MAKYVMLDLETMGNRLNPVIIQIAAVEFDITTGVCGSEFNAFVTEESGMAIGLHADDNTRRWWAAQSKEAQDRVLRAESKLEIREALIAFSDYINALRDGGHDVHLWGNGVRSDNVWLLSAYKAAGMPDPISYNEDLDFRTLHWLAKLKTGRDFKKETLFQGTPHDAIDDCKWQIACAHAMFSALVASV